MVTTPDGVRVRTELAPYGATGRPFNEIVVDARGRVWLNMPGSMPWEEPVPGTATVILPDGAVRDEAEDLWFPNGMVVTPDATTLVVAESHADRLTALTITTDGHLVDRRVWPTSVRDPHRTGSAWTATRRSRTRACRDSGVRVAEGGEILATVQVKQPCFSCVLGDEDGRTLYVVANDYGESGVGNGRVLRTRVAVTA